MSKYWTLLMCGLITGFSSMTPEDSRASETSTPADNLAKGYNAVLDVSNNYFAKYLQKYGSDLRLAALFSVCDYPNLSKTVRQHAPDGSNKLYWAKMVVDDPAHPDVKAGVPLEEFSMRVNQADFSWVAGYEVGYKEALRLRLNERSRDCEAAPQLMDKWLKESALSH